MVGAMERAIRAADWRAADDGERLVRSGVLAERLGCTARRVRQVRAGYRDHDPPRIPIVGDRYQRAAVARWHGAVVGAMQRWAARRGIPWTPEDVSARLCMPAAQVRAAWGGHAVG